MIVVSDDFKKAIKSDTREIYGYVDIQYQDNIYNKSIDTIPTPAPIIKSDGSGLLSGKKVMQKFATLENNYTLLNGSSMVWNENNIIDSGFISNETFENMVDKTFIINNESDIPSKGITIYFKDNIPFDFDIIVYDENDNVVDNHSVTNNSLATYQYVFSDELNVSKLELVIKSVDFKDNRLRVAYVDFTLGGLYDGDELVNFTVNEELDLLVESLPVNTCTIQINNYPSSDGGNKFDPINPQGIVKYLNNSVTIQPHIGVLTDDNGVEYVPLGTFYLSNWSSNVDGNVTLNGSSIINKMKAIEMVWGGNTAMFSQNVTTPAIATMITKSTNIKCLFPEYSMPIDNWSNVHTKLFDYLSYISPCLLYYKSPDDTKKEYRKIYADRYNNMVINEISPNVIDNISKRELLSDVTYVTKSPIKNVNVDYSLTSSEVSTKDETIVNVNYTLTKPEEYLWFKVDKYIAQIKQARGNALFGSAQLTHIGNNMHLIHAKVTGDVGSVINISYVASIAESSKNNYGINYTNNNVDSGETITLNFGDCEIPNIDSIRTVFFDLDKHYSVTAQTIGDPSLEIGDTVAIQTRYNNVNNGYKNMIITKQSFTYNGGLSCSLEGVGD